MTDISEVRYSMKQILKILKLAYGDLKNKNHHQDCNTESVADALEVALGHVQVIERIIGDAVVKGTWREK